jgi:hypothetical protein
VRGAVEGNAIDKISQLVRRFGRKEGREVDSDRSMLHPRLFGHCHLEMVIGVERQEVKVCLISDWDS